MKLNFYTEARYVRGVDGKIYSPKDVLKYSLYERYLSVFSEVNVVARVEDVIGYVGEKKDLVEGQNVSVTPLTYYLGPLDYIKKSKKIKQEICDTINVDDAYILRVPGRIGSITFRMLRKEKIQYGVEVVGDPFEVFSKNGVKHPLRVFFRYYETYLLKKIVKSANCALYVTSNILQKRYTNRLQFVASNVEIFKESLFERDQKSFEIEDEFKIISIGSLEQMYKGADVLLNAMKVLKEQDVNIKLTWVGDGKYKYKMIQLACELGLEKNVNFVGFLNDRKTINDLLDSSHLFVLASRTEGLPRVIIEAYSRSLPVIASAVGGIPELVKREFLFKNEDFIELSKKLLKFKLEPKSLFVTGRENLDLARDFTHDIINKERQSFFKVVSNK